MKNIRLGLILILAFLSVSTTTFGQTLKMQADSLYNQKDYVGAAKLYEQALHDGITPDIYYNLACAYYRQNQVARAILNYERALRFTPTDKDIQHNLALIRASLPDRFSPPAHNFLYRWWQQCKSSLAIDTWGVLGIIALALCLCFVVLFCISTSTRLRKIYFFLSLSLCGVFLVANIFAYSLKQEYFKEQRGVLMRNAELYDKADRRGKSKAELHAGCTVTLTDSVRTNYQVTLPDGRSGWVEKDAIEKI